MRNLFILCFLLCIYSCKKDKQSTISDIKSYPIGCDQENYISFNPDSSVIYNQFITKEHHPSYEWIYIHKDTIIKYVVNIKLPFTCNCSGTHITAHRNGHSFMIDYPMSEQSIQIKDSFVVKNSDCVYFTITGIDKGWPYPFAKIEIR